MDFIFDKNILQDMQTIISLYKKFDKYKDYTREDIYYHILPSIKLKQYKIFKENDKVITFANWAYLNDQAEQEYIKTGNFNENAWKSGVITWVVDVVSIKNGDKIGRWLKNKFKQFKWMRSDKNFNFYRIGSRGY
jgi:hemolysin-activating ACP:hemolysin acyltransferase